MSPEEWLRCIPSVTRLVKHGRQLVILRPELGTEDIDAAEQTLHHSLPPHLKQALLASEGKPAWNMLETMTRLLTPAGHPLSLLPTGRQTEQLFPTFAQTLSTAKEWAVFFDVDTPHRSFIGGVRPAPVGATEWPPDAWAQCWACYFPVGGEVLQAWEQRYGIQLSPQMQHLYLLMGGAPDESLWPFVYGPEELRRGELYEVYGELQEQLQLPEELLQLLQDFVVLKYVGEGDTIGFFASEPRRGEEYHIYQWLTEEVRFSPQSGDFSEFIEFLMKETW